MIVDDAQGNIDILLELLGDEYEVSVALNGRDAIEIAEENVPDQSC